MRARAGRCLYTALHSPPSTFICIVRNTQRRGFIDTPITDEAMGSGMMAPNAVPPDSGSTSNPTPKDLGSSYVHPLDVSHTPFKLYGESTAYANDDAGRIFSSSKVHSYDPAVLFSDVRLQEIHHKAHSPAGGLGVTTSGDSSLAADSSGTETQMTEDEENDAVMRSGRNKQGAAGAAAMAAAMLDSRRAADGIAMVPGHPLPVVFPRQDGQPSPPRFVKKFGPGGARQARAKKRARKTRHSKAEGVDALLCGEVMESQQRLESKSLQQSIVWRVQVFDEHRMSIPVSFFQHFHEAAPGLPARVLQGLNESGFVRPTLLQSAVIPLLMRGRDLVATVSDDSGTNVAYAVPSIALLHQVKHSGTHQCLPKTEKDTGSALLPAEPSEISLSSSGDAVAHPIVVILCTTRQAVLRTADLYRSLAPEDVQLVAAYPSMDDGDAEDQEGVMRRKSGCNVIVATPFQLSRLMLRGHVALDRVRMLVADSTNHLLGDHNPDGGSAVQHVEDIMQAMKDNEVTPQVSLWRREVEPSMDGVFRKYMSPLTVKVVVTREEHTNANVRQILYPLSSPDDRIKAIQQLYSKRTILKRDYVVVYCASRQTTEEVMQELAKTLSVPSSMIRCVHSGLRSRTRNDVLKAFRQGDIHILVGTDMTMKRLDAAEVGHVIHYDLPVSTDVYMQRVHQLGHSGRQGVSHTFLTPGDVRVPRIVRFVDTQIDHALNEDIRRLIAVIEAASGEERWDTAVVPVKGHTSSKLKWRVRGLRNRR
ncbi:uncharacterized protein JKF63_07948 [Porcisia hertigi]|uniref:RNA helicase n=1 Tax=Porcisia hertigi TaxID=2761500 RepID=A0A836I5M4_9TRYP|nr:hypothetical protein JKF63_07948 [Porcisia hertigi]